MTEPYPFSAILKLKPGGRHELLTAVVASEPSRCNGGGWRYSALFPWAGHRHQVAKVYSEEIESFVGMDTNGDYLCSGCRDETRNRCFAQGLSPATCT